jgi:TatD DNase family protein
VFVDTHVHFDDFQAEGSVADLLTRAKEASVLQMVAVGGSIESNALAINLAREHERRIFATAGLNRDLAKAGYDLAACREQAKDPAVLAIGEVGLDYFYEAEHADAQKKLFGEMLNLSVETQKPVVVHARDADDDTVAMLADFERDWQGAAGRTGVLHCFTREREFARKILDLGLYISFSGIVTFRNADALREVVQYVPDDRLLIETDAPYLAPMPMRGKRNEPAFVPHVAEQIAKIKQTTAQEIGRLTAQNASNLFGFALAGSV